MPKNRFGAEQIVTLLRQIEVSMAQGKKSNFATFCHEMRAKRRKTRRIRPMPLNSFDVYSLRPHRMKRGGRRNTD